MRNIFKSTILLRSILILLSIFLIAACDNLLNDDDNDENEHEDEIMYSEYGDDESHQTGNTCQNCHVAGGSGEGIFTIAGSVYQADGTTVNPNTTIKIYSGSNGSGDLLATIEVDGEGNFYTTQDMDWTGGRYVSASSATNEEFMQSQVTSGSCNSCHDGASMARITVN